jgi:SAM-dependent methyltransferase
VAQAPDYAFPHSDADEARRLQLFEERLDPLTRRRIEGLGIGKGSRCLEIGGGRGSVTRWLAEFVGPSGSVISTDLQVGFLEALELPTVEVVRHDIRVDGFPEASFDLVHTRAVLMHVPVDPDLLPRMVSWLRPGGWLLLEEPDFGMWLADHDPLWAAHPTAWHKTFPEGSLSRGRGLLRRIHHLGRAASKHQADCPAAAREHARLPHSVIPVRLGFRRIRKVRPEMGSRGCGGHLSRLSGSPPGHGQ